MSTKKFTLKVPATSANLGPGFDTLGIALSLYLVVQASYNSTLPEAVTFQYQGSNSEGLSTDPESNLITKTALYLLRSLGKTGFEGSLELVIDNPIPLGRGLGSSGSAVVAGVLLGNIIGGFELEESRLLDYILAIERHPDNVVPCLIGGLVAAYVRNTTMDLDLKPKDSAQVQITSDVPNSEEDLASQASPRLPPLPPMDAVRYVRLPFNKQIKAVAVIPAYHLATSKARQALPTNYPKQDAIFNLQRLAVLTQALGMEKLDSDLIFGAMTDKLHQPYRQDLIPGLPYALKNLSPGSHPGLLGLCLSGAGPTVLAFATHNFEAIGQSIKSVLDLHGDTSCEVKILDITFEGSQIFIHE